RAGGGGPGTDFRLIQFFSRQLFYVVTKMPGPTRLARTMERPGQTRKTVRVNQNSDQNESGDRLCMLYLKLNQSFNRRFYLSRLSSGAGEMAIVHTGLGPPVLSFAEVAIQYLS